MTYKSAVDIRDSISDAMNNIMDSSKLQEWFPDLLVIDETSSNSIMNNDINRSQYKYIAKVTYKTLTYLSGTFQIGSRQVSQLKFNCTFESIDPNNTWTRITIFVFDPHDKNPIYTIVPFSVFLTILAKIFSDTQNVHATADSETRINTSSYVASNNVKNNFASVLSTKTFLSSMVVIVLLASGAHIGEHYMLGMPRQDIEGDVFFHVNDKTQNNAMNDFLHFTNSKSSSTLEKPSVLNTRVSPSDDVTEYTIISNPQIKTESLDRGNGGGGFYTNPNTHSVNANEDNHSNDNVTTTIPSLHTFLYDLNSPAGIVIDTQGNLLVIHEDNQRVQKFSPGGELRLEFGDFGNDDDDKFNFLSGITLDKQDNIYVVDRNNNRVQKFDTNGDFILKFGEFGTEDGQFADPADITVDKQDNIYVVDLDNHRIQKFDSTGNFILKFGEKGTEDGQFADPNGIAIDRDNNIYIADQHNHRIQKFDSTGNFILKFGEKGTEDGQFADPTDITADKQDNIYVVDRDNHRIQKFDSTGNFILKFDGAGQFKNLADITTDSSGDVYVADIGMGEIFRISFEKTLATFSEQFDRIKCDADSMINDPLEVPPEVSSALPIPELIIRANFLSEETGQHKEALLFYYVASQIQPNNANAWNGIGYMQTFVCENDSSLDAYAHTLEIDPDNINAKIGFADFIIQRVDQERMALVMLESAEEYLHSALDSDSRNTNAINALGYIEVLRGDHDAAIEYYDNSLRIDKTKVTTLNGIAFAYLRAGNDNSALFHYDQALKHDADNFNTLSGLAVLHTQLGQLEIAEKYLDQLQSHGEAIAEKLIEQGNWLQQNGQSEEAQRLFDAAERLKSP